MSEQDAGERFSCAHFTRAGTFHAHLPSGHGKTMDLALALLYLYIIYIYKGNTLRQGTGPTGQLRRYLDPVVRSDGPVDVERRPACGLQPSAAVWELGSSKPQCHAQRVHSCGQPGIHRPNREA